MKVIKPQQVAVLCRTVERDQQFHFCVAGALYFHLDHPRTLLSEIGMWKTVPKALGRDAVLDEMIAKSRAEFLVAGSACAPGGAAVTALRVRVRVGAVEKRLAVIGDRVWDGEAQSPPTPFTAMPITWANAFGGEGFDLNPVGKGAARDRAGDAPTPLPNVEDPARLIRAPGDRPRPVGLMPLDIAWPQRTAKAGTYDDAWLKELFPGTARDVDWTLFNLAPEDQWMPDREFRGDEEILLENLHPDRPVITSRLPGAVMRCFVTQRGEGEQTAFTEVSMRPETLWLFPNLERAVLIYRGVHRVSEDDATDLVHLMLACEDPAQPRPESHYVEVLAKRTDKTREAVEYLRDSDLIPAWEQVAVADHPDDMADVHGEGRLRRNLRKKSVRDAMAARERVAAAGLDPDEHGPALPGDEPPPPTIDQLPQFLEALDRETRAAQAKAETMREEANAQGRAIFAQLGMDYSLIEAEQRTGPRGPPRFHAQRRLDELAEILERGRALGIAMPDVEKLLTSESYRAMLFEAERKMMEVYLTGAQLQEPVDPRSEEESAVIRQGLLAAWSTQRSVGAVDLTGARLAGLAAPGVGLAGSLLERVDLSGADLSGADLSGVVLAHANLAGARLVGANLAGANLGRATLAGADLRDADLRGALLQHTDLSDATLTGARMGKADLTDAKLRGVRLSGFEGAKLTFYKTDLSGLDASGADLREANFIECRLDGADFSRAKLRSAAFITCVGQGVRFVSADLENVRMCLGCDFSRGDFRGVGMANAGVRETVFDGSDFGGARLGTTDLSGCRMRGARLVAAQMRDAMMVRTDLTDADLTLADLMGAVMQKALVERAVFREANLYAADMARVKGDRGTVTEGANTKKVRVYPMRRRSS